MTSRVRRDFDDWFVQAYGRLIESAHGMHREPRDLVHHVYLACVSAAPPDIMRNPDGYFNTAMWMQATRGPFKRMYVMRHAKLSELPTEDNIANQIAREEAMLLTNHLAWFDRQVLRLYLEGYNLRQVSRESGISHNVLYQSLHRTKQKIRNAIGK